MSEPTLTRLPISLIILDGVGALLIALALAELFGEFDLVPDFLKFANYQIIMIVAGILLMLPFIRYIIKRVHDNSSKKI